MNRHALAEATSLHDGPVPLYLMEEIAHATKASDRDAEKIADYMFGRLNKSNLHVKLKTLQLLTFCIKEGSPAFRRAIGHEEHEIAAYIRACLFCRRAVLAVAVAKCRFDPCVCVYVHFTGPPDPIYGDEKYRRIRVACQEALVCLHDGFLARQQAATPHEPSSQATTNATRQWLDAPTHATPTAYGQPTRNASYPPHPSGPPDRPHASVGGSWAQAPPPLLTRPAPYPAHISNRYTEGPTRSIYPAPLSSAASTVQASSGLSSWSTTTSAPKSTGPGVWSSAGYQKKDGSDTEPPRYTPSSRRDNRPTVLVGHSLHFPTPAGRPPSGLGGFESGTYNPTAVRETMGPPLPNARAGVGAPSYDESHRRMGHYPPRPHHGAQTDVATTTTIGKKADVLRKMGSAALEKWECRHLDKSMASSLADHDELRAGPLHVVEPNFYPARSHQGAGRGDTSRDYERTLIDNLCASAGLSRAPSPEQLKRFVDLAQTLDAPTIGDLLLEKLEDDAWQVALKALHVVHALLDSPGAAPYHEFFLDHVDVIQALRTNGKPSVGAKALQVCRALGEDYDDDDDDDDDASATRKPPRRAVQGQRGDASQGEVDLLGFDALTLDAQGTTATPVGSLVHAPVQQVSLLDGYDGVSPASHHRPHEERTTAPSAYGTNLLALAPSSPQNRHTPSTGPPSSSASAFNFM
ncbi:hypothetical protein PsorP6_009342 [Peronosclerospora sorghi]|uniref:Uncharacterized protein n=1 Tax=Peronosclerospora sorghi TaxID=230839 RepID=A0ACC0W032_9STRA|nr:hypothetical protein PsorP6_009342 [Peronosclerospora sorghi]